MLSIVLILDVAFLIDVCLLVITTFCLLVVMLDQTCRQTVKLHIYLLQESLCVVSLWRNQFPD